MSEERWLPVVGYEGLYEVSDLGRIRSLPRKGTRGGILRPHPGNHGYPTVNPCVNGKNRTMNLHKVVAAAFLGPRPEGMQVRHLNSDPTDARLSNLAYGTASENVQDSIDLGTHAKLARQSCPSGHPYTEANIRRIPSRPNARYCRTCEQARGKGPGIAA